MSNVWLLLTPREDALVQTRADGDGPNAKLLRLIQGKVVRHGNDAELTLSSDEWARVQRAASNWKMGYERSFKAIIEAGLRHGA